MTLPKVPAKGSMIAFDAYGCQPFDDLFVSAYFNSEDEQQRPD